LLKADFSNWGPQLAVVGPGVAVVSSVPRGTGREAAIQLNVDGKGLQFVNSMAMTGTPSFQPLNNDLVFCNLGDKNDFPAEVKGKFALINRGTIAFADKVNNAISAGAVGVLIANNVPGLIIGTVVATEGTEVAIPAVMIEQSVGAAAQAALAAGNAVNATISVAATDYATFDGTSMATPHVSGVAALVRAANKSLTPAQVRDLLKSTATPLSPNDENQMGAGIVNAEAAVNGAHALLPLRQVAN
jgi:serine protease